MATPITPANLSSGPSSADRVAQIQSMLQQFEAPLRDDAIGSQIKGKSEPQAVPRVGTADLQKNLQAQGAANHAPQPLLPNNFLFGVKDNPIPVTGRS